jgi:hypothetical protein
MAIEGLNTGSLAEQLVGAQIVATAGNGYIAAELAASEASDTLAGSATATVSGSLSVAEVGDDTLAGSATATVSGSLSVAEVGDDTFAGSATATVSGSLSVAEVGDDTFAGAGVVEVYAVFSATEEVADTASIEGIVQIVGALAATEENDTIYVLGNVQVQGYEDASESPDSGAGTGNVEVSGSLAAQDEQDTFAGNAVANVTGSLSTSETGNDTFAAQGIVVDTEAKVERRPRRLSVHGMVDAKVFCRGGRSLTSTHSPTLVVINPEFVEHVQHGWAMAVSTTTVARAGVATAACGGGSSMIGGRSVTNVAFVESAGEAVIPVLGRSAYAEAVTEDRTAVAYGSTHISGYGRVKAGSKGVAKAKGSFGMTDAHFCSARGERRLPPSHTVAITALVTHGRFRRRVDTRL